MIRTLLTTTAIVAVLQTGAFAADDNAAMKTTPFFHEQAQDSTQTDAGDILANNLIGQSVYNSTAPDAEAIGDVNDIVLSSNGEAEAVIIGVGGFLGLGEKDVAIQFDRVGWVDREGERWIVVDATKEELEAAPAFERVAAESTGVTGTATPMESAENKDQTQAPAETAPKTTAEAPKSEEMQTVELSAISAEQLMGARVYGRDQQDVGEVTDVILTDSGSVEAFIVDVGGFLGINEKRVAVNASNIDFRKNEDGELVVFTPFTEEQLEQQASYSEKAYGKDGSALKAPRS